MIRIYALETAASLSPGLTKRQLASAIKGHVLAEGRLIGIDGGKLGPERCIERGQMEFRVKRLTSNDRREARKLFTMMADIFTEECGTLSDRYLDELLHRKDPWVLSALAGDDILGGVTDTHVADDQIGVIGDLDL